MLLLAALMFALRLWPDTHPMKQALPSLREGMAAVTSLVGRHLSLHPFNHRTCMSLLFRLEETKAKRVAGSKGKSSGLGGKSPIAMGSASFSFNHPWPRLTVQTLS